jgi:hypothetical protein
VFQSGFRRHHIIASAVLKVTEDIRLSIEDVSRSQCCYSFFHMRLIWWCMSYCCACCEMTKIVGCCWYAGGVISWWTSTVCEIWWSRAFCWRCDVWSSSGISSWSAHVCIINWWRLEDYQVLPFSHLCGWSADCCVSAFQRCIDELNLDLQRVLAVANGLELNTMKSQA